MTFEPLGEQVFRGVPEDRVDERLEQAFEQDAPHREGAHLQHGHEVEQQEVRQAQRHAKQRLELEAAGIEQPASQGEQGEERGVPQNAVTEGQSARALLDGHPDQGEGDGDAGLLPAQAYDHAGGEEVHPGHQRLAPNAAHGEDEPPQGREHVATPTGGGRLRAVPRV